jgi:MoxR-like ATPase
MSNKEQKPPTLQGDDLKAVEALQSAYKSLKAELAKLIVGQDVVIDQLLTSIFARGHCLLIGVPGLAKTMMIRTLADALSLSFSRVQFTPDLMPSDITGTEVIQENQTTGERTFKFIPGPIFANVILADEINRTPPKTQAALLESMQEFQVTAGGKKYPLTPPFFVLATQNPIEQEGTYPLPEAQQDRFMFNVIVDYPTADEELQIMKLTTASHSAKVSKVLDGEQILKLQEIVRRVPVADDVIEYALSIVRATRVRTDEAPAFIREFLSWGAGPRASQYLILGGKARALLHGRFYVSRDDIRAVVHPVLRHRIVTNYTAEAPGITPDVAITRLMVYVDGSTKDAMADQRLPKVMG